MNGGAPVGYLTELGGVEAGAVRCLRLWCEGPDGKTEVWRGLAAALGPDRGRATLCAFEGLLGLLVDHGRRPLMRHDVGCKCLGADEATFANFVSAAASGQREDAMLMAMLLVRPDMSLPLTHLAQTFGLSLHRICGAARERQSVEMPMSHPGQPSKHVH